MDLSVKFQEPTVGGLTGEQHLQLRLWDDENRCDFEDELNNRCPDEPAKGSRFCEFHEFDYDAYDAWLDQDYDRYMEETEFG